MDRDGDDFPSTARFENFARIRLVSEPTWAIGIETIGGAMPH